MKFIVWVIVNAVAILAATWLLDGITLTGDSNTGKFFTLLGVAVIFGVVNAVIGSVVKFLTFPFIVLSLGLLVLVINAAMLMLTSVIADGLGLGFHVDTFFWTAVLGAIVTALASMLTKLVLPRQ